MPVTYKLISSTTVGSGGASNVEFTSIPGTFDDLILKWSARGTDGTFWADLSFNGSTSNFTRIWIQGEGTGVGSASASQTDTTIMSQGSGTTASTFSSGELYIPNYASSNNKSVSVDLVSEDNATVAYSRFQAILWSNSAAITSIKTTRGSGNFAQYSTFYLYGIKKS